MGIVLDEHLEAICITPRRGGQVPAPPIHPGMQVTYRMRSDSNDRGELKVGIVQKVVYNPNIRSRWEVGVTNANRTIPADWCEGSKVVTYPDVQPEQIVQVLVPRERSIGEWLRALLQGRLRYEDNLRGINARVLTTTSTGLDSTVYLTGLDGHGVYAIPAMQLLNYGLRITQSDGTGVLTMRQGPPKPPVAQKGFARASIAAQGPSAATVTADAQKPQTAYQSPEDIAMPLREIVRGQDKLVETLAVAAYDHLVRPTGVKKGNVLVVGPTGTGKTESARSAAVLLGLPFAEAKLSGKSTTGFKGDNLATIFSDLQGNQQHPALGRAVLFLDEIDKVVQQGDSAGFGSGLQNELIGWVESATVKVPNGNTEFAVDTTGMLFVAAGAFVGLEEIIGKRVGVDLTRYANGERQKAIVDCYDQMVPDDLIAFGLKPELVGRFPYQTYAKPLSREMLIEILKTGKKSVFGQQVRLMQEGYGIAIEVDEGVYGEIADFAHKLGTGARGLENATMQLFKQIKLKGRRGTNLQITAEHARSILGNPASACE